MQYKKFDDLKRKTAERRWLEMHRGSWRVSGEYLFPIPEHVYDSCGGFAKLDAQPRTR